MLGISWISPHFTGSCVCRHVFNCFSLWCGTERWPLYCNSSVFVWSICCSCSGFSSLVYLAVFCSLPGPKSCFWSWSDQPLYGTVVNLSPNQCFCSLFPCSVSLFSEFAQVRKRALAFRRLKADAFNGL